MGLFKKKDDIPEIPSAPTLPNLPSIEDNERRNLPELPSFPMNSKNDNMNQEMVKSAVSDMPSPGEEEVHVEIPKNLYVKEEPKFLPPKPLAHPNTQTLKHSQAQSSITDTDDESPIPPLPKKPLAHSHTQTLAHSPSSSSSEPIFIRIDKFQSAQKHFESIKQKVDEIESVLGKIKDVKSKEEVELKGWSEDVEKIKARLSEIDADIFEQI